MRFAWVFLSLTLLCISLAGSSRAAVLPCESCDSCNAQIAVAADGDIVQLSTSVSNYAGTCISFGGKDNITFDCAGRAVDGNGSTSTSYGIWLNQSDGGSNNNTIRNCIVTDFYRGIVLYYSSNNTLVNITASGNVHRGVHFLGASMYNALTASRISNNGGMGVYMEASISENTDYASENTLYDNILDNTQNFGSNDVGNDNYLNASNSTGPNIVGGPYIGGNYWALPAGDGYSEGCADSNMNGFCDSAYQPDLSDPTTDFLPLTMLPPPDTTPPNVNLVSPTPANGTNASAGLNYMGINASLSEPPAGCRLDWYNGTWTNVSMTPAGSWCSRNMTALVNGFYQFRVYANDSAGNWNVTETRQVGIYVPPQPPQASLQVAHSISPRSVRLGQSTAISVNATSNGTIDRIIITITLPNGSASVSGFSGNVSMNYTPPLAGLYNITIFANTTLGSNLTVRDDFSASNTILFNCTVTTYNGTGIRAKMEFYYPGTLDKTAEFISDNGSFIEREVLAQNYDMLFKSFGDDLQVTLKGVNITQNANRAMGFDNLTVQNYTMTVAVNGTYGFSSASVRIYYSGINEDYIGVYRCASWNFTGRNCTGTWAAMNYTQDKNLGYVSVDVSSFSAFSLKQEGFCGDNVCQPGEDQVNCDYDCVCDDGENVSCGIDVGECRRGNLTCYNGTWGSECVGEIAAVVEDCNGLDDDCDSQTDEDLSRQCGTDEGECTFGTQSCSGGVWGVCAGNVVPEPETCNGEDDDCNGEADDNADCCTDDETRECGTSVIIGACHPGTSTCIGGTWSACEGGVTETAEVCNDGIDNDCDALTDGEDADDCGSSTCANNVMDGTETGVDCGGDCAACADFSFVWILVAVAGAGILGALLFMHFKLKKQGKELTWEELMKKWPGRKEGYNPR